MSKINKTFYAHSTVNENKYDWQLLKTHLLSVGELAAKKAAHFDGSHFAYVAGVLHDVGKYTTEFQLRLSGEFPKVDHSTWGAKIACERYQWSGRIIAYSIAGHHTGLANGRDAEKRTSLNDRLNKQTPALPKLLPQWEKEINLPDQLILPDFTPNNKTPYYQFSFFTRMIFSCLVDADYIDTEAFYTAVEGKNKNRDFSYPTIKELQQELDDFLHQFQADTAVNKLRSEILEHVRGQAKQRQGLFSLNVPTGGGKTLTSLAFALDHALHHGQRRVIYVIPFTSIVDQNAAVFRKAFGKFGQHAVLEHHSAYADDKSRSPEAREKLNLAMENWDAPIIVTTAVQFFESLYADRTSRCRKLHNIANSVVILDEAQTLPLKLLHPCVAAIDELALNYKTSLVLCTATQPALLEKDEFTNGFKNVHELAPDPKGLQQKLKRVHIQHIGKQTDDELIRYFEQNNQILCIVNNRRHAKALYENSKHLPGVYHLTTLMCAIHRKSVLKKIRIRLKENKACRLISTSLIEAGVDIDFPTVLRAETGLDSIAQAAGRCNREGRWLPDKSNVLVFEVGSAWNTPTELKQFAQAARAILRQHDDLLSEDAINAYFRELYWRKGDSALGISLLRQVEEGQLDNLPFETLSNAFQMIDTVMQAVIIPYDAYARNLLDKLAYVENCSGIARHLQAYIVQIPAQSLMALRQIGAVQPIQEERFGEQFMHLVKEDLYSEKYGISWENPAFIKAENLVI